MCGAKSVGRASQYVQDADPLVIPAAVLYRVGQAVIFDSPDRVCNTIAL